MAEAVKQPTWPEGLAEGLAVLKPLMLECFGLAEEAQRRVWKARDEVERLRRALTDAEVVLMAAERDYEHNGSQMQLMWSDLKAQVMKIPVTDA